MIISAEHGGFWYSFFYQLAFISAFIVFLLVCWRQKRPILSSLLIGISGAVLALVGSKLGTYSWADWQQIWVEKSFPTAMGKTTIGAFVLGSLGIVLTKRLLKYQHSILDALVFAVPVALVFQRLGCLFAGCCFGVPTHLPWGIQYGDHARVCHFHYMESYIGYPTDLSLSVHPVQFYFVLAALFTLGILLKWQSRFKAQGSLFLFGIAVLFAFRFLIEFFREPITNHQLGQLFWGMKQIQWVLLLLIIINLMLLYWNERYPKSAIVRSVNPGEVFLRTLTFALLPLTLLTFGAHWFDPVELIILRAVMLILFILLVWTAFQRLTVPHFRLASTALIALAILLMSQYPAQESGKTRIEKKSEYVGKITGGNPEKKKEQTISFGYLGHNIEFEYFQSNGCDFPPDEHQVGPTFGSMGLNYDIMWYKSSNVGLGFGFGGHYTTFKTRINQGPLEREHLGGLTGYYQMEVKDIFGFKAGLNLGYFPVINGENFDAPILPVFYLRFGPRDYYFLDGGLGNDIPFGFMASYFQMGGGIGLRAFDIDNSSRFRAGVTKIADKNALYFSSDIYVKKWIISPTLRVSGGTAPNYGLKLGIILGED